MKYVPLSLYIIQEFLIAPLSRAEAFAAARMFYEAIKSAAKSSVPGTDVIAAELKKRYYYTKSVKNEEPVETPEVTGSTN